MKSHNRGRLRAKVQGQRGRQVVSTGYHMFVPDRHQVRGRMRPTKPGTNSWQAVVSIPQAETDSRKVPSKPSNPLTWNIKEVSSNEYEEDPPSYKIEDWRKELEFLEKAMMRRYITTAVMAVWLGFALICVVRFASTGDGSSLIAPVLLSEPLSVILKFYYG